MKRLVLMCLCLCLCLPPLFSMAEQVADPVLSAAWEGELRGYQENLLRITAPSNGTLHMTITDSLDNVWLKKTVEVTTGENLVPWNGLGNSDERIPDGKHTLTLSLNGMTVTQAITLSRCMNALLFALPSADNLYLGAEEKWFAEVCLVRDGTVFMEVYSAGDPQTLLYKRGISVTGDVPRKITWTGTAGKDALAPGEYVLRYYESKTPGWVKEIRLTIREGTAPEIPLAVTGEVLPAWEDSDEIVWAMMQKPSAVVDIRNVAHQEIYAQPDKESTSLGTVHGQSQGLEVLELRTDGWAKVAAWNHECGEYAEGYVPAKNLKMVAPNDQYGLLIDKKTQRMAVFHQGKRIAEMDISSGLMAQDKLFRETPAGAYLTLEHMAEFAMDGKKFAYPIRYDGGNLLHQVPYRSVSGKKEFAPYTAQLGQKASNGCIRIPRDTEISAYWLWTHLPWHTRILILDDEEIRVVHAAAASGGRDPLTALERIVPATPTDLAPGETEVTITLGGDAVLGTRESWWNLPQAFPAYVERNGVDYFFGGLQSLLAKDDLTFINLECVLKDNKRGEDKTKQWRFRGLTSYAQILNEGSVELVNVANNHYIDYEGAGKTSTREALTAAGVSYCGYGYTWVWEIQGRKIGFGGCRETIYKKNPKVILQDVEALRAQGCEVIIYACHWGTEYSPGHNTLQEEMAKAASDAGVDVVVGHHPHVVQGVGTVEDTLVLWSLGNLVFGGTHDMTTYDGALARLSLRFGEEGYMGCTLEMIPVLTSTSADIGLNDFRPVIARGEDKARILQKIQNDSGVLLTEKMYFPAVK